MYDSVLARIGLTQKTLQIGRPQSTYTHKTQGRPQIAAQLIRQAGEQATASRGREHVKCETLGSAAAVCGLKLLPTATSHAFSIPQIARQITRSSAIRTLRHAATGFQKVRQRLQCAVLPESRLATFGVCSLLRRPSSCLQLRLSRVT